MIIILASPPLNIYVLQLVTVLLVALLMYALNLIDQFELHLFRLLLLSILALRMYLTHWESKEYYYYLSLLPIFISCLLIYNYCRDSSQKLIAMLITSIILLLFNTVDVPQERNGNLPEIHDDSMEKLNRIFGDFIPDFDLIKFSIRE